MDHRNAPVTGLSDDPELARLVAAASAVSFDFFDTLFTRPLASPEDAFDIIGDRFSIPDFRQRRRAAQTEAFRRMRRERRNEITLADIYACLPEIGDGLRDDLMRTEYALELSLVEPVAEVLDLLLALRTAGKPVAITSDMYLTEDFFRAALAPHGLADIPLFVSSSRNATKRDAGDLFDIVVDDLGLPASQILHIGDNPLGDVQRPIEKGLKAYHYRAPSARSAKTGISPATSLGLGLLRTRAPELRGRDFAELGFAYGGPATLGFLEWIARRAADDGIDHILFLSRDGYALERVAHMRPDLALPPFSYFLGSRTAFTLAAMTDGNFSRFLPFLLSGSIGLAPGELLERIGVPVPAESVMDNLGLGRNVRVSAALEHPLMQFLIAYRWEILRTCRNNRRALYRYLRQSGLRSGNRVALVDVGWRGTTQEAFELALEPLMDLDVFGYYFCLSDTPQQAPGSDGKRKMSAMLTVANTSRETIDTLYRNRVAIELFFSAPHASVIGWHLEGDDVEPVMDTGRGTVTNLTDSTAAIVQGIEAYAHQHRGLCGRLGFALTPMAMTRPMIDLVLGHDEAASELIGRIQNFDAWSSSRNHDLKLDDYLL